jgi:methyl-accepting chemotaxis protein
MANLALTKEYAKVIGNFRARVQDWSAQITVRLSALMLALMLLPMVAGRLWENWAVLRGLGALGGAPVVSSLRGDLNIADALRLGIGALLLIAGILQVRSLSRRATGLGLAADAFVRSGALQTGSEDLGRDELAWTASSFSQMMKRLQKIAAVAEEAATGDLTVRVKEKSENDQLARSLNTMTTNLSGLASQIAASANVMSADSEHVSAAAGQTGEAAGQIAVTMQSMVAAIGQQSASTTETAQLAQQLTEAIDEVARGAREQTAAVNQAVDVTDQLTRTIEEVSGTARAQALGAQQSVAESDRMVKTVEATVQAMESIRVQVERTAQKIGDMGSRSDKIGSIVQVIEDIASQTNLLALNAAIEAARAGEQGAGFAVVADEVRRLAERSSQSTKEITDLIQGIQRSVAESVQEMGASAHEVEKGVVLVNQTQGSVGTFKTVSGEALALSQAMAQAGSQMSELAEKMLGAMERVSSVVRDNNAATERMAAGAGSVTDAVGNIAALSEENQAAVEEVSASTQEIAAQAAEVATSSQELTHEAQLLREQVDRFKLDELTAPARPDSIGLAPARPLALRPRTAPTAARST